MEIISGSRGGKTRGAEGGGGGGWVKGSMQIHSPREGANIYNRIE